jgi:anti-anti-sigma factor
MALPSDQLMPGQQPLPPGQPVPARNKAHAIGLVASSIIGTGVPTTPAVLVSTCDRNGRVIVALSGELDILGAALVTAALAAVAACGRQVVVDLADLDFIDCSGITALVRGRKLVRDAGGELRLAAPQPQVRRILTTTRLTDVIPVHASAAEAAAIAAPFLQVAATPAGRPVCGALTRSCSRSRLARALSPPD